MTFDPIAWAARHGAVPGSPVDRAPAVTSVGAMFIDAHSLLCAVDPDLAAVTVEARLREEDLTLGLFPERYEVASVGDLVEGDDPGAGSSRRRLQGTAAGHRGRVAAARRPSPAGRPVGARPAGRVVRGGLRGAAGAGPVRGGAGHLAARRSQRRRPAARGGGRSGRHPCHARRGPGAADPRRRRPAGRGGGPGRARDRRVRLVPSPPTWARTWPGPGRAAATTCRSTPRRWPLPAIDWKRSARGTAGAAYPRRSRRRRPVPGTGANWSASPARGPSCRHRVLSPPD